MVANIHGRITSLLRGSERIRREKNRREAERQEGFWWRIYGHRGQEVAVSGISLSLAIRSSCLRDHASILLLAKELFWERIMSKELRLFRVTARLAFAALGVEIKR